MRRCAPSLLLVLDRVWVALLTWFMSIGFTVIVGNFGAGWLVWAARKGGHVLTSAELGLIL